MKGYQYVLLGLAGMTLLGGPRGAQATLPVTSGLQLHLDANAITGLNPGDPVTTWDDLSGNNYDAVTRVGYQNPTYQLTNTLTGTRAVVRFDPSDGNDSLQISGTDTVSLFGGGTDWTVFAAFAKDAPNTDGIGLIGSTGNPSVGLFLGSRNDTSLVVTYSGVQDSAQIAYPASPTGYGIATWTYLNVFNQVRVYTNGAFGALDSGTGPTTTNPLQLGGAPSLVGYFNGDFGELIVYNRLLSTTEREQMEAYLMAVWVIPEPSTTMLLVAGVALLRYRRYRR